MIALSRAREACRRRRARLRAEHRRFRRRCVSCARCGVLVWFAGFEPSGAAVLLDLPDRRLRWALRWLGEDQFRAQGVGIGDGSWHVCLRDGPPGKGGGS